jgi:D-galactarolactone cycloisomerase
MKDLEIVDVAALPCSVPMRYAVRLGLGLATKREAVVVKVTTADGIVGWGEAHHARAPAAIAALINTTIRDLIIGLNASETVSIWNLINRNQLTTHGAGAAASFALSGIDLALWDIRGKALGLPLYRLLGGSPSKIPAYAGGVSLGYQPPSALVDEVIRHKEQGFRAVKLRIGDDVLADAARVAAVRSAVGSATAIFTDANTRFSVIQARQILPRLAELDVGWLEEPFAANDAESYQRLGRHNGVPIAAGENHYLASGFSLLIRQGIVDILQPDVSKCGGITEIMRIGALAHAHSLTVSPHVSVTGINFAATIHVLASLSTAQYFEADVSPGNGLRDELCSSPYELVDGWVIPPESPGIGVEVDEQFLSAHPLTPGPAFVPNSVLSNL